MADIERPSFLTMTERCGTLSLSRRRDGAGVNKRREAEPETQRTDATDRGTACARRANCGELERRDERRRERLRKTPRTRGTMPSTKWRVNQRTEWFGSPENVVSNYLSATASP